MTSTQVAKSTTPTRLVRLSEADKHEAAELEARAFAGPPWFEVKKCSNCGERYGGGDDLERFHDGDPCRNCGNLLKLVEYWRDGLALEIYEDALTRPGFIGIGARDDDGKLIGQSWGFTVPEADSPTVRFGAVAHLLRAQGIEPSRTFYGAETAVDPDYQGQGIGTKIMRARLVEARDAGFTNVCFRTKNPKLVDRYEHFFGEDAVRPLFNDADPVKADRTWYACPLASLRAVESSQQDLATATSRSMTADAAGKRFEEYRLIIEDISRSSDRGQGTNDVFVALNGLFLTALGALLLTSSLRSWWIAGAFASVTLLTLFINGFWLRAILLRRRVQRIQIAYAVGIEVLLRDLGHSGEIRIGGEKVPFGIFSLLEAKIYRRNITHGRTRIELQLAAVITATYPIATAVVAVLTYMITNGYLPPLSAR